MNWILQSILESCFIMNSITIFLCDNIRRDNLNSETAVGNRLTFLSWICVWCLGIICIHLVPNKSLKADFSYRCSTNFGWVIQDFWWASFFYHPVDTNSFCEEIIYTSADSIFHHQKNVPYGYEHWIDTQFIFFCEVRINTLIITYIK